jgi:hypothetical protein
MTAIPQYAQYGSAEHAAAVTKGRHPGVQTALAWLAFTHLPEALQDISAPTYNAAVNLLHWIPNDSDELTSALNRLVEAKDWFMRAGIRSNEGKPGPVPRPATVVDPPRSSATAIGTSIPQNPGEPYMDYLDRASRQLDAQQAAPIQDRPIHHYDDPEA